MALGTKEKNQVDKDKAAEKAQKSAPSVDHKGKDKDGAPSQERLKALGLALDSIKKQYGDGSIMKLGDSRHGAVEVVSTGALSLDVALGVGGLPKGRIIEIYGPESSGKTTLAQHVAAEAQRRAALRHRRCRACYGS